MKNNFLPVAVGVSKTGVLTSTQDTEWGIFFALRRLDRNRPLRERTGKEYGCFPFV